jgi:hypothetical protein
MNTTDVPTLFSGVLCLVVFGVSFLAGDIAGWIMERKWKQRWQEIAANMGFTFYGQRNRWPSLSEFLLPKLLLREQKESAFCYGEALTTFSGIAFGFHVTITDFAVWNFYSYPSLVFRAPMIVFQKRGTHIPITMVAAKNQSMLLNGFRLNSSLREYRFPNDKDFSSQFVFFGRLGCTPWTFTTDLRDLCVTFEKDIDCLFMGHDEVILVCNNTQPDRIPDLVEFGATVMRNLVEDAYSAPPLTGTAQSAYQKPDAFSGSILSQ